MPDPNEISAMFEALLRDVDHATTSTTKYREFERYLAELLHIPAADIYTTHVRRPGNFDVRMTQSERARRARVRVALLPAVADVADVKELAARIARDRNPGTAVLLVCDSPEGWAPQWGIEPDGSGLLSAGSGHRSRSVVWPDSFELSSYPHASTEGRPQGRIGSGWILGGTGRAAWGELRQSVLSARPEVSELLYRTEPSLFTHLIENDATARDVVAISSREAVVRRFRRLLEDPDFFSDAAEPFGGRREAVWQNLLEENPWILGVSLAGQVLTSWNEHKLEQVVAGFSISGPGKRSDAVMRTNGRIRAMVFAEIKHHETRLLSHEYRPGCWAPSPELSGGVVQVQQTVHLAGSQINGRLADTDDSGAETGEHTYMVRPRSFLILGNLEQLRGLGGVHRAKYESFELYRRNLYEPEILTFDELLARAEWHVRALDEAREKA